MKVPFSWLKEYVETKSSAEKVAEKLLLAGTKAESLKKVGKEIVLEFEITPNRPDTLSVLGVARELAAIENLELKFPDTQLLIPQTIPNSRVPFKVSDKKLCPYFSSVKLKDVELGDSPKWLQEYLNLAGMRSISNVVDITNFVMLETGLPLHTFDAGKIVGELKLRGSKAGEKVKTLDGVERVLPEGAIIIEDDEKLVDLAGLMGGENSGIDKNTNEIILLVPIYDPVTIRKTSLFTNLRTEASNRFEKKLDPNGHVFAINRAIKLFSELASAKIASKLESTLKVPEKVLVWDKTLVEKVIGIELTDAAIIDLLSGLEFIVQTYNLDDRFFEITVPSFRTDIEFPEDILEEIARIYGYNKLPKTIPASIPPLEQGRIESDSEVTVRNFLLRNLFNESTGYTLVSEKDCTNFGFKAEDCLKVKNPSSSDFEYLRPTLGINLVKAVSSNPSRADIRFFEIAKIFEKELDKTTDLPKQPVSLGLVTTADLNSFKGIIWELFNLFRVGVAEEKAKESNLFDEGVAFVVKGKQVGNLGKIKESISNNFDIRSKSLLFFEIDFSVFQSQPDTHYRPLPKYPAIKEDISFYLAGKYQIGDLISRIKSSSKYVYSVNLIDVFSDSKGRSLTLSFEFMDPDKTLEAADAKNIREKIIRLLQTKFEAKIK